MPKFELISNWKDCYKMYSFWFFIIIAMVPELYELAINSNVIKSEHVPEFFMRLVNTLAFMGAASRLIKQKGLEKQMEKEQT